MWGKDFRDEAWKRLSDPWDLVVVGGGITGAGILSEATRAGFRTLLVEGNDFASGTSSRSTKLVHGGLRYLRQGQFLVTRKSVKERERMLDEGRGLVENLPFSLAAFPGDKMPRWMFGIGLSMYDALAWKWNHERLNEAEILRTFPMLNESGVLGGYRYHDAQTDDARLTLRVVREGVKRGGTALNYVRAIDLLRDASGRVRGVVLRDQAGAHKGRTAEVSAKAVINATGAWADDLRGKIGERKRLRKIRGSHLVFAHSKIPVSEAVSFMHPRDQRGVFAVPWEGVTLVGTTDVDHGDDLETEPRISESEAEYILEGARKVFPTLNLTESDVACTYAGVRPVIDTGHTDPSKESREHAVWQENGLYTITGGKLTTWALMAREALEAAREDLGPLPDRARMFEEAPAESALPSGLSEQTKRRLVGRLGEDALTVADSPHDRETIGESVSVYGELRKAARDEGCMNLSDLLLRRVRVGLTLPEGGLRELQKIREVAQPELGWSDAEWDREEAAYRATWNAAYAPPK